MEAYDHCCCLINVGHRLHGPPRIFHFSRALSIGEPIWAAYQFRLTEGSVASESGAWFFMFLSFRADGSLMIG